MRLPFEEELLENVRQFATIESEKLPSGLSEGEVLVIMRERAGKNRKLMRSTNEILDQYINPLLDNPHTLTDEEADSYAAFADRLFSRTTHLDTGLALLLHRALLERARANGDIDRMLRHLYFCGLIGVRWASKLQVEETIACFQEAVSFKDRYFQMQNKETRMFFNRCLGNLYVSISSRRTVNNDYTDFFEAIDLALSFWNDERVRALDPDFPWQGFILNSHQNITSWLDRLRTTLYDDRYLANRVYESVNTLYGGESVFALKDPVSWPNSRTVYAISAAKYHMGLISAREVTASMKALFDSTKDDDYSEEGVYRMMHVSCCMLEYMRKIPGTPVAMLHAEEKRVCDRVYAYCQNLPADMDRFFLNNTLANFLPPMMTNYDVQQSIRFMLSLTTFTHMPTHVHSIMVSKILEALTRYFLRHKPELLIGVRHTGSVKAVLQKQEEILSEVCLAAMAHDAGKVVYIHTVSLCSRRLTDMEFFTIREHVGSGFELIKECVQYDPCIADVIRGHHKWYDGSRGYPESFDNTASPYRFVIDMTSVADSLDAATDSIGRSYATQLTLEEIIAEIQEGAGTRYSPEVAQALNDPELRAQLEDIIVNQRAKVYYSVYENLSERRRDNTNAAQA